MTHVRKSKIVLDPGFHAVDSEFYVVDSRFSVSGSRIPAFNHSRFFELHCGFPHMRRYEVIEKKLLSSVKERKCILRKQKEKIVLLLALIVRSTLLSSQFSQRIL